MGRLFLGGRFQRFKDCSILVKGVARGFGFEGGVGLPLMSKAPSSLKLWSTAGLQEPFKRFMRVLELL